MPRAAPEIRQTRRGRSIQIGMTRDLSIFEINFPVPSLPAELEGMRILHLSDAHFDSRWCDDYDAMLATIAGLDADLIAFTGDWIEDKFDFRPGLPTAQRFARGLRSKFGTFSCLGNHDGDLVAPYLLDAGIRLLVGEAKRILGGASAIEIIGLPGVAREDASPTLIESFGPPMPNTFRLLLTHFPDHVKRVGPIAPHLMLAGHTHGGQICLPSGTPIFTHDSLPRTHAGGLHQVDGMWLHTSRGIGCSAINARLFCAPEVTLFKLQRSS